MVSIIGLLLFALAWFVSSCFVALVAFCPSLESLVWSWCDLTASSTVSKLIRVLCYTIIHCKS